MKKHAESRSMSKGSMPKGNKPGMNRSPELGNSNKHNTSKGPGMHGRKYVASAKDGA